MNITSENAHGAPKKNWILDSLMSGEKKSAEISKAGTEIKNSAAEISQPQKKNPPAGNFPPAELCPICHFHIFWQSIYRDGIFRCAECEPWPDRKLAGEIITLGVFLDSTGGKFFAWMDSDGKKVEAIEANAAGQSHHPGQYRGAAAPFAVQISRLELFERTDKFGVVHRRWTLPGMKGVVFG